MAARSRRSPWAARVLSGLVVLAIGVWLGGHPGWLPSGLRDVFAPNSGTRLVSQVVGILKSQYYRPVNQGQLVNKGLTAMVASLDDPYSHYYDPSSYRGFLNDSDPHLSGIGIDVLPDPHGLAVVDVFPGSPAAQAGLEHGDIITRAGATALAGRSADFSSGLIKGRAGTKVTLAVLRGHATRVVTVTRADIVVPVTSERLVSYQGVKIGDLQLTSFTQGCGAQLRAQAQKALRGGARALILDLRENGGGLLEEAVNVASLFIPDGTIVSTAGRAQPRQVYVAKGNPIAPRIPMVVLVDKGTASAAEIVTGALQDRHRATVVGTHTYGKGVFQEIEPLGNGGALDITVGEYFTPSGRNLGGGGVRQGAGISPSVHALDNPHTRPDEALDVAERTVAAPAR